MNLCPRCSPLPRRKLTLGAEWSLALWPLGCESFEQPLAYNDLAMARVGRGWMFDVAVAGAPTPSDSL